MDGRSGPSSSNRFLLAGLSCSLSALSFSLSFSPSASSFLSSFLQSPLILLWLWDGPSRSSNGRGDGDVALHASGSSSLVSSSSRKKFSSTFCCSFSAPPRTSPLISL